LKPFREDRTGLLRRRLVASFTRMKAFEFVDQKRIGVIGYCFGGLCALDLARINAPNLAAAVSFHGSFTPLPDQPNPGKFDPINASVLICHGDADTHIPAEQVINWDFQCRKNSIKNI
jgi:dienelactone hydrolase